MTMLLTQLLRCSRTIFCSCSLFHLKRFPKQRIIRLQRGVL